MATAHEVSKGHLAHDLAQITLTWEASNTTQEEKWKWMQRKLIIWRQLRLNKTWREIHGLETFNKKMDLLVRSCLSLSQFIYLNMSCKGIIPCGSLIKAKESKSRISSWQLCKLWKVQLPTVHIISVQRHVTIQVTGPQLVRSQASCLSHCNCVPGD